MTDDVSISAPTTLRGRVGRIAQRIVPDLDQRAFFRARKSDNYDRLKSGDYDAFLRSHPVSMQAGLIPEPGAIEHAPHVVVIPYEGRDFSSWAPGYRNFYFEAAQVLRESSGEDRVSVFHVERGEPPSAWHMRLIDYLNDVKATHIITHIESDPGAAGESWTWDTAWPLLAERWGGSLLGVMFDSAYRHTLLKGRYLARISPRFVLVDICAPMDGQLFKGRPEVGPINMPMSNLSVELVDDRIAGVDVEHDVSFIGVLYPYRQEMIELLKAQGMRVAVNPHRTDNARTRHETLANQPSWLEYMAALASSKMTINFSESAARPVQQLKTRVIEAGLAGTFLLTDDVDLTSRFWREGIEYGYFSDASDVPQVVEQFLADPARLEQGSRAFAERARALAHSGFWSGIDSVLARRGLATVGNQPTNA